MEIWSGHGTFQLVDLAVAIQQLHLELLQLHLLQSLDFLFQFLSLLAQSSTLFADALGFSLQRDCLLASQALSTDLAVLGFSLLLRLRQSLLQLADARLGGLGVFAVGVSLSVQLRLGLFGVLDQIGVFWSVYPA